MFSGESEDIIHDKGGMNSGSEHGESLLIILEMSEPNEDIIFNTLTNIKNRTRIFAVIRIWQLSKSIIKSMYFFYRVWKIRSPFLKIWMYGVHNIFY